VLMSEREDRHAGAKAHGTVVTAQMASENAATRKPREKCKTHN
jgi:hypothetical protein